MPIFNNFGSPRVPGVHIKVQTIIKLFQKIYEGFYYIWAKNYVGHVS